MGMIRRNRKQEGIYIHAQKATIEREFTCLKCVVDYTNKRLVCKGKMPSNLGRPDYKIKITQVPGFEPRVYITDPQIKFNPKIHLYKSDNRLCLYKTSEMNWGLHSKVYSITIPRIAEWILYYELFTINGGFWEGPSALH